MVEGAGLTELALLVVEPVLAGLGLVVRVHSSEGGFAEVQRKWLVFLSELVFSVGELAVVHQGTSPTGDVVLAHFGLVLLAERDVVVAAALVIME